MGSNDYFTIKKINANCFESISVDITVEPSDLKILFIFDDLEDRCCFKWVFDFDFQQKTRFGFLFLFLLVLLF